MSLERHLGKGPDCWERSELVVHTHTFAPATREGSSGREDEELVLDAKPTSKIPGAALGKQTQGPAMEN